jgi:CSLREA domain-containing protein
MNHTNHRAELPGALRAAARLFAVAVLTMPATATMAGIINVTDFGDVIDDDDGSCTLREAIRTANTDVNIDECLLLGAAGADLIVLSAGTYRVDLANDIAEDASF